MFSSKLLCVLLTTHIALTTSRNINTAEEKCNLSSELVAEIRSYQSVANKIAAAAVNGSFTGNIWRGCVKAIKLQILSDRIKRDVSHEMVDSIEQQILAEGSPLFKCNLMISPLFDHWLHGAFFC